MLISGPSKAVLDCQKDVLDQEIRGIPQSTNKMDGKSFYLIFCFLNENFTSNGRERSRKKIPFRSYNQERHKRVQF